MKNNTSISVVIPAYNESPTIAEIMNKLLSLNFVAEIVVVDDASTDDTATILKSFDDERVLLIQHAKNQGKTAALRAGFAQVSQPITVLQDADLEYDPDELECLCQPIWDKLANVVYGSRFLARRTHRVLYFPHATMTTNLH